MVIAINALRYIRCDDDKLRGEYGPGVNVRTFSFWKFRPIGWPMNGIGRAIIFAGTRLGCGDAHALHNRRARTYVYARAHLQELNDAWPSAIAVFYLQTRSCSFPTKAASQRKAPHHFSRNRASSRRLFMHAGTVSLGATLRNRVAALLRTMRKLAPPRATLLYRAVILHRFPRRENNTSTHNSTNKFNTQRGSIDFHQVIWPIQITHS